MNNASTKKLVKIILLVLSTLVSLIIVGYYWSNSTLSSISLVPIYVMVLALCYVILQIIKRFYLKVPRWWDWLYYIGLISIMIPTFFADDSNQGVFHFITDYGSLFLIFPILFDIKTLFNGNRN
jgi:hypothetical protein